MFNSFLTFGYEKAPMHLAPGLFDNFDKLELPYYYKNDSSLI